MADEIVQESTPQTVKKGWPKGKRRGTRQTQTGVSPDMQALIAALTKAQADAPKAQAEALAKIQNPSNIIPTGISVFNPRGIKLSDYEMPRLKCEIHAPWRIHPEFHGLDREEVELFNLLEPGEYMVTLTDDSRAKVTVKVIKNDTTGVLEKMHLVTNWTEEHKGKYPSMRKMLREMIGAKANAVMTIAREHELIKSGELSVSV